LVGLDGDVEGGSRRAVSDVEASRDEDVDGVVSSSGEVGLEGDRRRSGEGSDLGGGDDGLESGSGRSSDRGVDRDLVPGSDEGRVGRRVDGGAGDGTRRCSGGVGTWKARKRTR